MKFCKAFKNCPLFTFLEICKAQSKNANLTFTNSDGKADPLLTKPPESCDIPEIRMINYPLLTVVSVLTNEPYLAGSKSRLTRTFFDSMASPDWEFQLFPQKHRVCCHDNQLKCLTFAMNYLRSRCDMQYKHIKISSKNVFSH